MHEQQDQFNVKIAAVHDELKNAQHNIQSLGMQALETQAVKEEDIDSSAKLDLQQAQASQALATALAKATQAAEKDAAAPPALPAMEVNDSDEEHGEGPNKQRKTEERKRSLERAAPKASSEAS